MNFHKKVNVAKEKSDKIINKIARKLGIRVLWNGKSNYLFNRVFLCYIIASITYFTNYLPFDWLEKPRILLIF